MVIRVVFCCIDCCLCCLESCMKFISRNAYIQTAIHGGGFCTGCKEAFFAIARNIYSIGAVSVISGRFICCYIYIYLRYFTTLTITTIHHPHPHPHSHHNLTTPTHTHILTITTIITTIGLGLVVGKIWICVTVGLASFYWFTKSYSNNLHSLVAPTIFVMILAYITARYPPWPPLVPLCTLATLVMTWWCLLTHSLLIY